MSNVTKCDNPTCENTRPPARRLCDESWWKVEAQYGADYEYDFCSKRCVGEWATQ